MLSLIKKTLLIGTIALAIGYAGDACSVQNLLNAPFRSPVVVEQGYAQPDKVGVIATRKEDGSYETSLTYNNLNIPLFERTNGPQLGSADYLWANLDEAERQQFGALAWDTLDNRLDLVQQTLASYDTLEHVLTPEQKAEVFSAYWTALPQQDKAREITTTLPTLDATLRRAVALQELAELLGAQGLLPSTSDENNNTYEKTE